MTLTNHFAITNSIKLLDFILTEEHVGDAILDDINVSAVATGHFAVLYAVLRREMISRQCPRLSQGIPQRERGGACEGRPHQAVRAVPLADHAPV